MKKEQFLAVASVVLGLLSVVAWLVPIVGYIVSVLGIFAGLKASDGKPGFVGLVLSMIGLILCVAV